MSCWLHPQAEQELAEAAVHYATQANRAVAAAFLAEFERVRDLLLENPARGPATTLGLRIYHFNRFPYSLIYEPEPGHGLRIYAVAHQRRQPGYWLPRA